MYDRIPLLKACIQHTLPTVYTDDISYTDLVYKTVQRVNEIIKSQNALSEEVENFIEDFSTDLESTVKKILDDWKNDGTLNEILNTQIFNDLWEAVNTNQTNITTLNNEKIGKSDTNYVGMGQLTQEVKEALTGGSTAVVGDNTVNTTNIVKRAVNEQKLAANCLNANITFNRPNEIRLNTESKTITLTGLNNRFYIYYNGKNEYIENVTLTYNDGTQYILYDPDNKTVSINSTPNNLVIAFLNISPTNPNIYPITKTNVYIDNILQLYDYNDVDLNILHPNFNTNPFSCFDIDTVNNTLTLTNVSGGNFSINLGSKFYSFKATIELPAEKSFLQFDITTLKLSFNTVLDVNKLYLAQYLTGNRFYSVSDCMIRINNNIVKPVTIFNPFTSIPFQPVIFDFVNEKIRFDNFTTLVIEIGTNSYTVTTFNELDMSTDYGTLFFDPATLSFVINSSSIYAYPIANYFKPREVVNCNFLPYTVITNNVMPYSHEFMCVGDSMVAGNNASQLFITQLFRQSGIPIHNYGVGGCGYVHKTTTGTTTIVGNGEIGYGTSQTLSKDVTVPTLLNDNINKNYKGVIIFAGTNDFSGNVALEEFKTSVTSCINTIYNNNKLGLILTPIPRSDIQENDLGLTLQDYVEAIKDVCNNMNFPYADLYNNSGFYPANANNKSMLYNDDVHVTAQGSSIIAAKTLNALTNFCLIPNYNSSC